MSPLSLHGLSQSVAFSGEDHDVAVVDEPVNQSSGEPIVSKYRVPLRELQI